MGRFLGIGIANMVTAVTPDRVVIGGGVSAAADLLLGPIRDEVDRRVLHTSLDEVEIVVAELGTWAGAIGAAVHGAARDGRGGRLMVDGHEPSRPYRRIEQALRERIATLQPGNDCRPTRSCAPSSA